MKKITHCFNEYSSTEFYSKFVFRNGPNQAPKGPDQDLHEQIKNTKSKLENGGAEAFNLLAKIENRINEVRKSIRMTKNNPDYKNAPTVLQQKIDGLQKRIGNLQHLLAEAKQLLGARTKSARAKIVQRLSKLNPDQRQAQINKLKRDNSNES